MEKKKEKITFSKIEVLFMIVLVALLMVAGITVFTITTNKKLEQNLKEAAINNANLALNEYTYRSIKNDTDYIVVGSDGLTKGMCISIKALDPESKLDGYFVVEETKDKKKNTSVWLTDGKLVIDGYSDKEIEKLSSKDGLTKFNDNKFMERVQTSFVGAKKENGGIAENPIRYEAKCVNEKME